MADSRHHHWLNQIVEDPVLDILCEHTASHPRTVVEGSRGSSTVILAGAVAVKTRRPVLLVVAHPDEADDALDDLELFPGAGWELAACRFPAFEVLPGESCVSFELLNQRLQVVERLRDGGDGPKPEPLVLIAPIQALMQSVPEPAALERLMLTVRSGQTLGQGQLLGWLGDAGYERVDVIEQPGQFAARGGIVDIYLAAGSGLEDRSPWGGASSGHDPVRLDFFGDQIETIHKIDPDTMGSGPSVEGFRMIGASVDRLQSDCDTTNLLSLIRSDTLVMMHEMLELSEQSRGYYERLTDPRGIYPPKTVFKLLTNRTHIEANQYSGASGNAPVVRLPLGALPSFDRDATRAIGDLAHLASPSEPDNPSAKTEAARRVVVLCQKQAERDRLIELMTEIAPEAVGFVDARVGYLHRGFAWGDPGGDPAGERGGNPGFYVIPHHELFHRYHIRRRLRGVGSAVSSGGRVSDAFLDMQVGDYVVHVDHGVARFVGLSTMKRKGKTEEYLTLEFANRAKLHVPATQIELVQKYVGGFHGKPPLSIMGGKRWGKQKQQVAEAVKDLAAELLRVQAARASMPGICYPPDTVWQCKFEEEFPYQETEDQQAAIVEVKKDMNHPQPMDRLICGDVGFGKTEVAVRAVFKAIEYGKQAVVLVPTTVLAEQHERTFRDRMADYPFRVESISRFKTAGEASKVLAGLARGEVDVIIGTHRLLSGDVTFNDLGLVIIDEEQRFGVEHKQKLMQLRLSVDVLTLSATPIPRTLHMSMLGLRDISSLTTPPLDRRAIVTEVIPYDGSRVKQAIIRELNRDGQVYFVHNRVHKIQSIADEIHKLVPEARIAIGHGQMLGHELEKVMLAFMRREVDVLVCTTIIESGIDIPTANTIFINGADRFGLADLHQLRGRVGRYKHRAYCYLLLPMDRPVTDTAARRLRAIEQYTMLGAGFKIAMRDLEIRGAGNLLGAQQSGHIATVGYEMYCQLLEQAAKRLRNESDVQPVKTHIELPLAGRLPKRYIASEKFRLEAYRRLSRCVTMKELETVGQNLTDAYGDPPAPARVLLDLTELRIAATHTGVDALKLDGPDVIFRTAQPRGLESILQGAPGRVSLIDDTTVYWRPPTNYTEPATLLAVLRKIMKRPMHEAAESA